MTLRQSVQGVRDDFNRYMRVLALEEALRDAGDVRAHERALALKRALVGQTRAAEYLVTSVIGPLYFSWWLWNKVRPA